MKNRVLNQRLKILVTLGLSVGYFIAIRSNIRSGKNASAIGNSMILPASLIWLWFVSDSTS